MTSGTGTCNVQYNQGGELQLQPCAAGHRDGECAEGRPDDHREHPRSPQAPPTTRVSVSPRTRPAASSASRAQEPAPTPATTFTLTQRQRHLQRQLRPGRQRELQRGSAGQLRSVNAQKAGQTINVTTHAPASASFNQQFTVAATGGGSGNPVTFSRAGPARTRRHLHDHERQRTCSVKYDQAGNGNYNEAPQVTETVQRGQGDQGTTGKKARARESRYNTQFMAATVVVRQSGDLLGSGSCSNSAPPSR